MKKIILVVVAVFFGITLTLSQEIQKISTDSLPVVKPTQNTIDSSDNVDIILNDWQLLSHHTYENYPEDKTGEIDFIESKEFLNLSENGAYASILNNNFNKGFWLQNNNLLVFKQKVPTTVDVYYEVVAKNES
jgi:CNT family concentrative nucleoside transporter